MCCSRETWRYTFTLVWVKPCTWQSSQWTCFMLLLTTPDTCSCSTGTLAGQMLTKLSMCCGTCFTNNYHTICTVSELFSISVSVSLALSFVCLFLLCFLFPLFLFNSSKPWVNEEEVGRAAWIVCLSDFLSFWSC